MFNFVKKLFVNKPVDDQTTVVDTQPAPSSPSSKATAPVGVPPSAIRPPAPSRPAPRSDANGNIVHIPLQSVLNNLPLELKGRVRQTEVGEATLAIPVERVLSQLSLGSVKITFGDLRRVAPKVFSTANDCDQIQVALPLQEILSRINPAMLVRRQDQRQVEVPDEVSGPFGDRGQGLAFSSGPAKPQAAPPPRAVTPAPQVQPPPAAPKPSPVASPRPTPIAPPKPIPAPQAKSTPPPAPIQPKPAPIAPASARPSPIQPTPIRPPAPVQPAPARPSPIQPAPISPAPIQAKSLHGALSPSTPQPIPAPAPTPTPFAPSASIPASQALRGLGASLTPARPAPAAREGFTRETIPNPAEPTGSGSNLVISLSTLAESWPEPVRQEIVQSKLADAKVALPADTIQDSMKRGRLAFPWKVIRSWIKPPVAASSVHDNAVLELPLKVVAPLMMARQKEGSKAQQKVSIDDNIPNLFFGFPQADAPEAGNVASGTPAASPSSHAVTKPVDTNYYVWDDESDSARVDENENKKKTPGTEFVTRYATPNEVVSRAAALDGVAGALIALPDGLMVASRLAQDLNGDTLAAFLPHIFGKVSACTKELRMGELNNLNFTVGNVPWKIFRVNAIFFAAFGRVGQPLPTAQLAALAGELDHKKS